MENSEMKEDSTGHDQRFDSTSKGRSTLMYPGLPPGHVSLLKNSDSIGFKNSLCRFTWSLVEERWVGLKVENLESGQTLDFGTGAIPSISLKTGHVLELSTMSPSEVSFLKNNEIRILFQEKNLGISILWKLALKDDSSAMIQSLEISAHQDISISECFFLNIEASAAQQVGDVSGSVLVNDSLFMAIENPLAQNLVTENGLCNCSLPLNVDLEGGHQVGVSYVIGAIAPQQLRKSFLAYLEERRIHPYRQHLHYNNWYDVWLGRAMNERWSQTLCRETIEYFKRELVDKRGVSMDAFVWDDGWDDFDTLWDFHSNFPDGFQPLNKSLDEFGAHQGVWMSPNGGYSMAKDRRVSHGKSLGFETNPNGFAMAGKKYFSAFRDRCLNMIRQEKVGFFKFDGMGEGGQGKSRIDGAGEELSKDIFSILLLCKELHEEKQDVFVSTTVGTWPSPFWLLFSDCIWRQGKDTGRHGDGDTRQQWITYRDKFTYERIVKAGPLYPLNSVMLHGLVIGDRPGRAPQGMDFNEGSVGDEIWSFFSSGTCLQELYVSPNVPTPSMLDQLGKAANWARQHEDLLVDTHWVGGNPGLGEVYGWASGGSELSVLSLRNPSAEQQSFSFCLDELLERTIDDHQSINAETIYKNHSTSPLNLLSGREKVSLHLPPFGLLVIEIRLS
jgi:hypothetical protein